MAELSHATKQAAHKPTAAEPASAFADHDRGLDGAASAPALDVAALAAGATAPSGSPTPPPIPPRQLLRLQRTAGNHQVARLLSRRYANGTLHRSVPTAPVSAPVSQPAPARPIEPTTAPPTTLHRQVDSGVVQRFDLGIGSAILGKVAGWAKEIPGYHLLTLILGKDPISGDAVERNAMNVAHGILSIVPGGNKIFENLQQSGALERFFDWVSGEFGKLGLTFASIKALFSQAWDALDATDLLDPGGAWTKVKGVFGPPLGRIKDFAIAAGKKVLEFILEGVLKLAGPLGDQVMAMLKKGGEIFNKIVEDPIGFLGNLLKAVKGGFEGFMANILEHLKNGLMGWLFGALAGAGLAMPKSFDLKGILSIVLQVLGLTYQNLRGKLVAVLGEKTVGYIETAVTFVKTLVTEGLAGAWKMIVEWVGNLQEMVIGAVQDWVVTSIVKAAVTKLVTMFNPVGAIIQGIITVYNTITFFIERAQQIAAVANSIFDSVGRIAAGDVGGAAAYVEQTMAKAVPVMLGFLASLIGLGGIGNTIRGIIEKIQSPIQKALDKVVGVVAKKAKALVGKVRDLGKKGLAKVKSMLPGGKKPNDRTDEQQIADRDKALREATQLLKDPNLKPKDVTKQLPRVKSTYRLNELLVVTDSKSEGKEVDHVVARAIPEASGPPVSKELWSEKEIQQLVGQANAQKNRSLTELQKIPKSEIETKTVACAGSSTTTKSGWGKEGDLESADPARRQIAAQQAFTTANLGFEQGARQRGNMPRMMTGVGATTPDPIQEIDWDRTEAGDAPDKQAQPKGKASEYQRPDRLAPGEGYDPRRAGSSDWGVPGKYVLSHAEKGAYELTQAQAIGVSRGMCPDCQAFFVDRAQTTQKVIVVADPAMARVFLPDGTMMRR